MLMRSPFAIGLILIGSVLQAQPPMPFPQGSAEWTIYYWAFSGPPGDPYEDLATTYSIIGDSSIGGVAYRSLASSGGSFSDLLVRDDNGKWFFIPEGEQIEYLLYDFTVVAGDTITINNPFHPEFLQVPMPVQLIVQSIIMDTVIGRRVWDMRYAEDPFYQYGLWIEGIGSTSGLTGINSYLDGGYHLKCFQENGIMIYPYPASVACETALTIERPFDQDEVVVFPSPASDLVEIRSVKKIHEVILTDMAGRRSEMTLNDHVLDVSSFPAGIYVIQIIDRDQRMHSAKLVVER